MGVPRGKHRPLQSGVGIRSANPIELLAIL